MRYRDAARHINAPVIVDCDRQVRDGEIVAVDPAKRLVQVQLRSLRPPYRWTSQRLWYAPGHLKLRSEP